MRIPYIAGRWVRGRDHYGRQRLITHLLRVEDPAIWVVGTRRMGKTSLLRQLELETDRPESELVPLFWDLQGVESFDDLSYELFLALEDVEERFAGLGVDVSSLQNKDAVAILRRVNRALMEYGKRLFVLIDEAEVLINIGQQEPKWLARLRKIFQNGEQRTVITSTKLLSKLNEVNMDWSTSPFLFGFSLANLWRLDPNASLALIAQQQSECPVEVDSRILDDILVHTNRHPYLMQYLCQRLFVAEGVEAGCLRPPEEYDLNPDHLLAGFFQTDFQHLTTLERRILLTISNLTVATDEEVISELNDQPPDRIRMFMYALDKLGYLRKPYGQWAVGNEFMRRWMQDNYQQLTNKLDSMLDESNIESLIKVGRENELQYLHTEIARLQHSLHHLRGQRATADSQGGMELAREIQRLDEELRIARHELNNIPQRAPAALASSNGYHHTESAEILRGPKYYGE
ncbi:MAG: ATP-binding protein [Caldilineaceae bacterium]|nr:ATP-binding protein [Caldilineaceae bacterium]